ncbi:MAG: hypothetical protein EKK31_11585 [Hyphomicrobiales bacterium]|nr:MAG: hypothetical protein EKK31_11585 [Hyphomicrobiales bacterium]
MFSRKATGYRKIVIHCGLHKTGSSYLQQLFLANRNELKRKSVYYPEFRNPDAAAMHKGNHSIVAVSYDKNRSAEENLSSFFDLNSDCDTLLISGEEFSRVNDVSGFLSGLKQFAPDADIRLVFYLRRYDHMIESVYSETVKYSLTGDISRAEYQLDYGAILAPFIDAVGLKQITVRPYNRALWYDEDLATDFFASSGLHGVRKTLRLIPRTNEALSRQETFMLSLIRTTRAKQLMTALLARTPLSSYESPGRYFRSASDRRRFNAAFAGSGQKLADKCGLGDIGLFLDLWNFDDDPTWAPFDPDWLAIAGHLTKLGEELADALSK